jgi:hypothetical protein
VVCPSHLQSTSVCCTCQLNTAPPATTTSRCVVNCVATCHAAMSKSMSKSLLHAASTRHAEELNTCAHNITQHGIVNIPQCPTTLASPHQPLCTRVTSWCHSVNIRSSASNTAATLDVLHSPQHGYSHTTPKCAIRAHMLQAWLGRGAAPFMMSSSCQLLDHCCQVLALQDEAAQAGSTIAESAQQQSCQDMTRTPLRLHRACSAQHIMGKGREAGTSRGTKHYLRHEC